MLRITIELVPHGNESQKKTIGVAHVSNIGGNKDEASYNVVEMTETGLMQYRVLRVARRANIFRFIEGLFIQRVEQVPPVTSPDKKGE